MMAPMPQTVTVLETIHGSHLYGLATPASDLDTYRVVVGDGAANPKRTRQRISGDQDVLQTPLSAFMVKCAEGVPQALEAMFSSRATVDVMGELRSNFYLSTPTFAKTYRRTILNFARLGVEREEAMGLLAPTALEEATKERVRESYRLGTKPRRVERNGLEKYRRHAVRLALNLEEGLEYGRFSPTLTAAQVSTVRKISTYGDLQFAEAIMERVR